MLKIHKKLKIPLLLIPISLGGIFLYQYLTFIPEYSSATEISTEDPITPTTPVMEWDKLEYMQQMTPEACNNATKSTSDTGDKYQKQLIDIRDGKTYWVARIGDDCWMTQSLDLDLSTSKVLTPDDTNIKANWTPTENTQTSASPSFDITNNTIKSWDPGYKYYANGTTVTNSDEALAKDTTGQVNAHYLVGNYYTWVAAMAGNTTGNTSDNDICPKGWQLPLSNSGTNPKTFQALTNALGATSGTSSGNSDSKLLASPAYFVRGGLVDNTSLNYAGSGGYYWSSVPYDSSKAYYLRFSSSNVGPSGNSYDRFYGFSVRCVTAGTPAGSTTPSDPSSGINNPNISVSIPNILTLEVTDSVTMEDIVANTTNTQEFTATVTSNANYTISINATTDDTYATSLVNIKDDHMIGHIDSISSPSTTLDPNQWGIKACSSLLASCDDALFQPLPTKDQNPDSINPFFTSTPGSHTHLFQIGINPSPSLPSGTYSTSIQVTAATSD